MNALKKLITKITDETSHSIVVMQYKRGTYTLGDEQHFHWALLVVTDTDEQDGYLWQAVNRILPSGGGEGVVVWDVDNGRNSTLAKTFRCLGGVTIGMIKPDDLSTLSEVR